MAKTLQTAPHVKILIADDHAVVREGVRMILQAETGFDVVGEAADGQQAVELASALSPDVVVMDISMPQMGGIEATQQIRRLCPKTHVLILTMHEEESYVFQLMQLGASGYVLKRAAAMDLVEAVRAAFRGKALLYPSVARRVVADYLERVRAGENKDCYDGLTDREREILVLLAQGLNNAQIGNQLSISVKTVQTHRATHHGEAGPTRSQLVGPLCRSQGPHSAIRPLLPRGPRPPGSSQRKSWRLE
jgi:two-component system response regulator NreC